MMDRVGRKKAHFVVLSIVFLTTGIFGSVVFVVSSIFYNHQINNSEIGNQITQLNKISSDLTSLSREQEIVKKMTHALEEYFDEEIEGRESISATGIGIVANTIDKRLRDLKNRGIDISLRISETSHSLELLTNTHNKLQSDHFLKQSILSFILGSFSTIAILFFRRFQYIPWPTWSVYLIHYLPEEVIGELGAFHKLLSDDQKSTVNIRSILFFKILESIWAFHVQIKLDNLSLPSKNRRIDD